MLRHDDSSQILVFRLGPSRVGLPLHRVCSLTQAAELIPLPKAPPAVLGALDLHGRLVAVFDLAAQLLGTSSPYLASDHLVVARRGETPVALRVHEVLALEELAERQVTSADALARPWRGLAGVASLPDGPVLIHDLDALMTQAEERALAAALAAEQDRRSNDEVAP